MSTQSFRDIRSYLCSSSSITNLVPKGSIKIGWPRGIETFPCILLSQVAGSDTGYLGYRTADAGSRVRREDNTIQVDIFSRRSRQETYNISDEVVPLLIASGACRKDADADMYDDEKAVYRKVLTFSFSKMHDD